MPKRPQIVGTEPPGTPQFIRSLAISTVCHHEILSLVEIASQMRGKSRAKIIVTIIPTTPMISINGLIVFNPSRSVIPLMRVMIQKALSLSQLTGFEPQPIAMAR
jgi:hypothetical protein